jgi:hypothetical protein
MPAGTPTPANGPLGQGPGVACHHVGGGDNPDVVPTQPRPYARRVRKPGIVWPERPPIDTKAVVKRLRETDPETPQREKLDVRSIAHRLTAAERDELIRRYKDGEASTKLAAVYGLTSRSVRKFLTRNGVELRSRADANRLRFTQDGASTGPEAA